MFMEKSLAFLTLWLLHVSGNYKCRFSVNKNASKSASLISDLQRNKIIKNDNFNDCFLLKTSLPGSQKKHFLLAFPGHQSTALFAKLLDRQTPVKGM
jgi:hypothetical protein